MAKPLTPDERADIEQRIRAGEPRNAIARATGRSAGTITAIAEAAGLSFDRSETRRATAAKQADNAAKRAELIAGMYDDALRLRRQMFGPAVERKALVVSDGMNVGSHVEIVDVDRDEPTFSDKRNVAVSVKVLADGAAALERVDAGESGARGLIVALVDGLRAGPPPVDADSSTS